MWVRCRSLDEKFTAIILARWLNLDRNLSSLHSIVVAIVSGLIDWAASILDLGTWKDEFIRDLG
ncbi:hypothetical protein BCR37DRAFT_376206 [Protomyces lactucae-debilis]|uniref:Uncharacterized protein n=1 Tax=Protomyces lactucae-debilis TaxID=2754530 RepID=A0A1Y2FTK6_PROLT|nr:uncharacterized protein BCR37DRAFT_376206 [Protomyces lactucae-debilis]ORY86917.1 hypothetical protein BCR37DRAFT_376206 [Protomyces lactucae-debilis]